NELAEKDTEIKDALKKEFRNIQTELGAKPQEPLLKIAREIAAERFKPPGQTPGLTEDQLNKLLAEKAKEIEEKQKKELEEFQKLLEESKKQLEAQNELNKELGKKNNGPINPED